MEYKKFFKTKESFSYFVGFTIADGHMSAISRNRGKIQIEIRKLDQDILLELQNSIHVNSTISQRTRESNFSKSFTSKILTICDLGFRSFLLKSGVPYGTKLNVNIPESLRYNKDLWRGIIDGDGSIGITKGNKCFISLVTKSQYTYKAYVDLLERVIGYKPSIERNKRDGVYNIVVTCENAKKLIRFLDYSRLSLCRKRKSAEDVLNWVRPNDVKKITHNRKRWTKQEDEFIQKHSIEESIVKLNRTPQSIKSRLWRLSNNF